MHHRRNRTNRREGKRLGRKKLRAAERDAMNGSDTRVVPLGWSMHSLNREIPVVDEEGRHHKSSKRQRPKKERCPVNGVHEWYKEWITTEDYFVKWARCMTCVDLGWGGYQWGCRIHGEHINYTVRIHQGTCIHCWAKKEYDRESTRPGWRENYRTSRSRTLPKRKVKF